MSDKRISEDPLDDPELNDLLDSALEDFNKTSSSSTENKHATPLQQKDSEQTSVDDLWTKDFIKHAADQFEKNLQSLIQNGSDNELGASFQKMAQTVANAIVEGETLDEDNVSADFQSAIAQALKDLSTTSENLQNEPDLTTMLGQVSLEEGVSDMLPFMQNMMQSLLSKDILYPSLKDLVDKYPEWLEQKRETLSATDFQKYTKQLELMQQVCNELEEEKDGDLEDIKKRRFEKILLLMQEMQGCGQPPEDLIGEQPTFFQFDAEGNPIMPASSSGTELPQNCCLM